ncbi:hypothetical protein [Xanthomarina gelatinilytica]|uniref:hypothetical protein n=1 Tax=Xanthomarina gelatinilytica TaxID=1137281 RepID=UPI00243859DF
MEIKNELIDLLKQIDRKRDFGEYTMTELQKIAEKAIKAIQEYNPESDSIVELKESIRLSDKFHKESSYKSVDNIMSVLRSTKFAIESFLYKEFGIEI